MERLTKKDDFFDYILPEQNAVGDNQATEISLGETEYTCKKYIVGEAINHFAELEDVMEKYNIENIGDLELRLEDIEHYAFQVNKQLVDILAKYGIENLDILDLNLQTIKNINIQNANLRNELAELKQKAIVPKFEKGQLVYFSDDYEQTLSGSIVALDYYTSSIYLVVDTFGNTLWKRQDELFTDKEQAEAEINKRSNNDEQ